MADWTHKNLTFDHTATGSRGAVGAAPEEKVVLLMSKYTDAHRHTPVIKEERHAAAKKAISKKRRVRVSKKEVLDDVYEKGLCACVRGTKTKQNR